MIRLVVLSKDELQEIEHFCATGKRTNGVRVTDRWVEESLGKTVKEIHEQSDACDTHDAVSTKFTEITMEARKVYRAWKRGEDIELLMKDLGKALNSRL